MRDRHTDETPTQRAVRIAGGQSELARRLGLSPQAVQQWVEADRVSHKRVLRVSRLTGVPAHELRPDLFQLEPQRTDTTRQANS